MNTSEYPALFAAADSTSMRGQAWYTGFVRADLILVVLAAAFTAAASLVSADMAPTLRAAAVAVLVLALLARMTNRIRRPEREWFDGRAVAESVKTAAWKYMMHAEPYAGSAAEADTQLASDLRTFIQERKGLPFAPATLLAGGQQITARMRAVRELHCSERRALYLSERVQDQQDWYATKSDASSKAAVGWFLAGLIAQGAALALGVLSLVAPGIPSVIGVFTSLAAAATAWTQLRRHDELAQSYGLAAQELSLCRSEIEAAPDEQSIGKGVQGAEDAISREHKLWVAKRSS